MNVLRLPNGLYRYDPNQPLGRRGGFGQVFAGKTEDDKEIAVKRLHVTAAEAAHRELRIAEEFRGKRFKYVMEFIDSGEDAESGGYFVVMSRAEKSLQSAVDSEGTFSSKDVCGVLLQVAKGLIEVGELVHRDLKPDNVLLHDGSWKVADFGIARFLEEATGTNTLKEFLSPPYAAPEQWRLERATHATDAYALGCIGFCLLTGEPPFKGDDYSEEHQHSPVPAFTCEDPRLGTLLNMMLRKMAATRPQLSRIEELLEEMVRRPHLPSSLPGMSHLISVGAEIAAFEQESQAQAHAEAREEKDRSNLMTSGLEILSENLERLWGKVHTNAANARRLEGTHRFEFMLGQAALLVEPPGHAKPLQKNLYPKSRWDVIVEVPIQIRQRVYPSWRASLLYAMTPGREDYRWNEVFFAAPEGRGGNWPFVQLTAMEQDGALARGQNRSIFARGEARVAYGPMIVDDEQEDLFHDRWMQLLAMAARGELGYPKDIPFSWPPETFR